MKRCRVLYQVVRSLALVLGTAMISIAPHNATHSCARGDEDPAAIQVVVERNLATGVGFGLLPPATQVVTVHLIPKGPGEDGKGHEFEFEGKSERHDPSGTILWNLEVEEPKLHTWEGDGLAGGVVDPEDITVHNSGPSVRFEGELRLVDVPMGPGPGPGAGFRVSVADLDIDIDSLGLHWTDPERRPHWPPLLPHEEDANEQDMLEDVEHGGLYLPPSIWEGEEAPTFEEAAATHYKIMNLNLRTKWKGFPGELHLPDDPPELVGQLTFSWSEDQFSGPEGNIYLYLPSKGIRLFFDEPIFVNADGFENEPVWLVTSGWRHAYGPASGYLTASFTWLAGLNEGGDRGGEDRVRLAGFYVDFHAIDQEAGTAIRAGFRTIPNTAGVIDSTNPILTTVVATVTPCEAVNDIDISVREESPERVRIHMPADGDTFVRDEEAGTITFQITGRSATPAPEEGELPEYSLLDATYVGQRISSHDVVVVVPASFAPMEDTTKVAAQGHVTKKNNGYGLASPPVFFWSGIGDHLALVTAWETRETIRVKDQFGEPLDLIYAGADVWGRPAGASRYYTTHRTLHADGKYEHDFVPWRWAPHWDPEWDPPVAEYGHPPLVDPSHGAVVWWRAQPTPTLSDEFSHSVSGITKVAGHTIGNIECDMTVRTNDDVRFVFPEPPE